MVNYRSTRKLGCFFFKEIIPPLILGAFFSRRMFSENGKYIYVYTAYKKSQKIDTDEIVFENYEKELYL